MKKASIADVAAAAGVSTATVDRVINGRPGVSAALADKVYAAAQKLQMDRALHKPPEELMRIGVLMQRPEVPFYHHLARLAGEAGDLLAEHRIVLSVIEYRSLEPADVVACIELASQRLDALIVVAPAEPLVTRAIHRVSQRKPVVTLITDLPACGRIAFVGPDNARAGRVAGALMGRFIGPGGGPLLLVTGLQTLQAIRQREAGFIEVLQNRYPACTVVETIHSREDQDIPERAVLRALERHPTIRGIYNTSVGDEGIARALESQGRGGDVVVIAHDLNASSQALIERGTVDAVLEQDSHTQLLLAVQHIQRHSRRRSILHTSPDYGIRVVLRENL